MRRSAYLDGYGCRMTDELPHRFIGAQMSDRLLQQGTSSVACQQTTSTSCKFRCIQYSAKFCLLSILDISECASGLVFRPIWRDYPSVFTRLIYRDRRRWKGRIGKRSHRYGAVILQARNFIMNRRPTIGAEMEGNSVTVIADPNKLRRATADEYISTKKAGLRTEYAASAALAS